LWRIPDEKLKEILANPITSTHEIKSPSNNFGEFVFTTTGQGRGQQCICMTFWGMGYHEYRERWIQKEWFWHQTPPELIKKENKFSTNLVEKILEG